MEKYITALKIERQSNRKKGGFYLINRMVIDDQLILRICNIIHVIFCNYVKKTYLKLLTEKILKLLAN